MPRREAASVLVGLTLAAVGVIAFTLAEDAPGAPPAPAAAAAPSFEEVSGSGEIPGKAVPAPEVPASAAGPTSIVVGVTAELGSLRKIDPAAFGIPAEIGRVLAARGVILTVTTDALAPAAPDAGAR